MMVEFTKEEIALGLILDAKIAEAQTRLDERLKAKNDFIQFLGSKYKITGDISLNHWLEGFILEGNNNGELHD